MDFEKIKPMLLSEKLEVFNDKKFLYELKFDGIRALILIDSEKIIIKSRNNIILNDKFPELLKIKNNIKKKCIFDGEIVLMHEGIPSFSKLRERMSLKKKDRINIFKENYPVTFVCFDILYENKSLIDLTLIERKKILDKYEDDDYFVKSRTYNDGIKLFKFVKNNNLEGIVAKLKTSKYIPNKRTDYWIKIKRTLEEEFYILGYKENDYVASLLLGEKHKNKFNYVSIVLISKKNKDFNLIKECKNTKNILNNFKDKTFTYIIPKYKCSVTYLERTKNNHLRHAVFNKITNKSTKKG